MKYYLQTRTHIHASTHMNIWKPPARWNELKYLPLQKNKIVFHYHKSSVEIIRIQGPIWFGWIFSSWCKRNNVEIHDENISPLPIRKIFHTAYSCIISKFYYPYLGCVECTNRGNQGKHNKLLRHTSIFNINHSIVYIIKHYSSIHTNIVQPYIRN